MRIVEIASIGPGPFAAMMLADMGATVLRVDRPGGVGTVPPRYDVTRRGRPSIAVDLRHGDARGFILDLVERADALVEGFRPGVMERLGLGPVDVHERNPRVVYGRVTGYGQDGPLAAVAGHDINYLAAAGVLGALARDGERPLAPLNLVGDYGGGAMYLAFGVVCGLHEAARSGRGQVVDAAMVDGVASLTAIFHGMRAEGRWADQPGTNMLDSGAHFYDVYVTADGGHVALGAIEPQFYSRLLELLELDPEAVPQWERDRWPELREVIALAVARRSADEWAAILDGEEACATVVRGLGEAPDHPHLRARGTFVELDGVVQPQAAPRFDRTPGGARPTDPDTDAALEAWGVGADARRALRRDRVLRDAAGEPDRGASR
ncbi:CaiB/BaiF CoA-transferase family protein [Paraconexibacter sp. AEG42_29]|uniref:CaiB/BaiF CoA transferase family protein n=1 Tax=Paraconexibacter sp. AEG42_29 TaxID=2997339 RepID=UPI00339D6047